MAGYLKITTKKCSPQFSEMNCIILVILCVDVFKTKSKKQCNEKDTKTLKNKKHKKHVF